MATTQLIDTLIGGLDTGLRRVLKQIFYYVLNNLRFGHPTDRARAVNFQTYFYHATTSAAANTEFTIAHGLGRAPYLLVPVVSLIKGEQLVDLKVTRTADTERIYLSSSQVSAPVSVMLEA